MSETATVGVVGGGSWGTALANAVAARHPVTLWLRDADHASRIEATRENTRYLPGVPLHPRVRATADAAHEKMMSDKRMEKWGDEWAMPFDGKRMVFGGFDAIVNEQA